MEESFSYGEIIGRGNDKYRLDGEFVLHTIRMVLAESLVESAELLLSSAGFLPKSAVLLHTPDGLLLHVAGFHVIIPTNSLFKGIHTKKHLH